MTEVTIYRVSSDQKMATLIIKKAPATYFDVMIGVDEGTTEHCLEEYGRCDGVGQGPDGAIVDFTAVPFGEFWTGPWMPDRSEQED